MSLILLRKGIRIMMIINAVLFSSLSLILGLVTLVSQAEDCIYILGRVGCFYSFTCFEAWVQPDFTKLTFVQDATF